MGNKISDPESAFLVFQENPKEVAYMLFELFHPEIRTFRADDEKELRELKRLGEERLQAALRYVPRIEDTLDPIKLAQADSAIEELDEKRRQQNNIRSKKYINEGQEIADRLGYRDFAIIIGASHIKHMVEVYRGRRNLYVIRPRRLRYPN